MVIIPRIEFQLQAIILSKNECDSLMSKINNLVKHRAGLAVSSPNWLLYNKDIFGLKHVYDLQLENLSKNLLYEANDEGRLKELFIKLIQEQTRIWMGKCPGNLESKSLVNRHS